MHHVKHLFFDLDHTLWDFDANAKETLQELYVDYLLDADGFPGFDAFFTAYNVINDSCWELYRNGELTREVLRLTRFRQAFESFGSFDVEKADRFGEDYMRKCPYKTNLFPGAIEVLETLGERYDLHIITNGFAEVQAVKLRESQLEPYFKEIITSEKVGVTKPDPAIFKFALECANATPGNSVMIGDHLHVDALAARKIGMEGVWFNPHGVKGDGNPTHEIRQLKTLLEIY